MKWLSSKRELGVRPDLMSVLPVEDVAVEPPTHRNWRVLMQRGSLKRGLPLKMRVRAKALVGA